MPHHEEHTTYQPDQTRKDDAGIHKEREAIGEKEAQLPARGPSQSEEDRDRPRSPPASEPTTES